MLKLKDPISLKSARPLLSLSEGFAERILGNYALAGARITPKELLFAISSQAELPEDLGGMTTFAVQNNISDQRTVVMDIVNNVVNRILLMDTPSFTYQDDVYIETVLRRLGVRDVKLFLSQVSQLKQEETHLHSLLRLYQQEAAQPPAQRQQGGEPARPAAEAQAAPGAAHPAPAPGQMHQEIFQRLSTALIYQTMANYMNSMASVSAVAEKRSLQFAEQSWSSSLIALEQQYSMRHQHQTLSLFHTWNRYESQGFPELPQGEEQVLSQAAAAVLFSSVSHVMTQRLTQSLQKGELWQDLSQSLSETVENSLTRFEESYGGSLYQEYAYRAGDTLTRDSSLQEITLLHPAPSAGEEAEPGQAVKLPAPPPAGEAPVSPAPVSLEFPAPQAVQGEPAQGEAASLTREETLVRELREAERRGREARQAQEPAPSRQEPLPPAEAGLPQPAPAGAEAGPGQAVKLPVPPPAGEAPAPPAPVSLEFPAPQAAREEPAQGEAASLTREETLVRELREIERRGRELQRAGETAVPGRELPPRESGQLPARPAPGGEEPAAPGQAVKLPAWLREESGAAAPPPPAPLEPLLPSEEEAAEQEASPQAREEALVRELQRIDQQNRERRQQLQQAAAAPQAPSRPPEPDRQRIMRDALRAIDAPEQVIREIMESAPLSLEHPKLSPEAEALLAQADAPTRELLRTVLQYQENPQAALEGGLFRPGSLAQLNLENRTQTQQVEELIHRVEERQQETETRRETQENVLEEIRQAARPPRPAPPPQAEARRPLQFVHKQEIQAFPEELLEQLQQRSQTVTKTETSVSATEKRSVQESEVRSLNQKVAVQNAEDIQALVNRTLSKQMNRITDQVYQQMEKRLQKERFRRGRF